MDNRLIFRYPWRSARAESGDAKSVSSAVVPSGAGRAVPTVRSGSRRVMG